MYGNLNPDLDVSIVSVHLIQFYAATTRRKQKLRVVGFQVQRPFRSRKCFIGGKNLIEQSLSPGGLSPLVCVTTINYVGGWISFSCSSRIQNRYKQILWLNNIITNLFLVFVVHTTFQWQNSISVSALLFFSFAYTSHNLGF